MRHLLSVGLALALLAVVQPVHAQKHKLRRSQPSVSRETRDAARKLAKSWVDTAAAGTLDDLSERSIAFSGMVPGVFVVIDGHRISATRALNDSALTILGEHTRTEDAAAIRNIVCTLNLIADGHEERN